MEFRRWVTLAALVATCIAGRSVRAQPQSERVWLGGRYDGTRVIAYFDAVRFGETFPKTAVKIPPPVADRFFSPAQLTARDVARLQRAAGGEPFEAGDRFDILSDHGAHVTATLTSIVGFLSDEQVGNDSYIGGLLTVDNPDFFVGARQYYVVRRHVETPQPVRRGPPDMTLHRAGLDATPIRFDLLTQLASMMTEHMTSGEIRRRTPAPEAPLLAADRFTLADGSVRYYVRAEWRTAPQGSNEPRGALAAWMRDMPLQILATQDRTPTDWSYSFETDFPVLLNVVQLDAQRTALIVSITGEDNEELRLVEYKDGVDLDRMRILDSLSTGE